MPTVKVALDNLPKDATVEIPYLGNFKNNTTTEVDQRKWNRYKANWPAADTVEGDTLEVSTAASKEATKARAKLSEAVEAEQVQQSGGDPEDKPLSKRSKSELEKLATAAGQDPEGKSKEDLVALLSGDTNQGG